MNPLDAICNVERNDAVCVSNLKNARKVDKDLLAAKPDIKIFLPYRFHFYKVGDLFAPNKYKKFLGRVFFIHFLLLLQQFKSFTFNQWHQVEITLHLWWMEYRSHCPHRHLYRSRTTLRPNNSAMEIIHRPTVVQTALVHTRLIFH